MSPQLRQRLVKVSFLLDPEGWHSHGGESLWASFVSDDGDYRNFRLENSPFYATGVSYRDVVRAKPTENPVLYDFESVVARGGHSKYMIL
ncbi:MAG: DUF4265 domain-containing protein, partial [Alphaproteobacteria bacterium]|nr:DUF4265 domain-containing protein [Alphaproteobacteria bacterium]